MSIREAVHPHLHMVGEWSMTPARHLTDAAATAPGINIIWPLDIDLTNKKPPMGRKCETVFWSRQESCFPLSLSDVVYGALGALTGFLECPTG